MANLKINITGSATKQEIITALNSLITSIQDSDEDRLIEGTEFEDEILMSVFSEND